jgi:hypothetical protein
VLQQEVEDGTQPKFMLIEKYVKENQTSFDAFCLPVFCCWSMNFMLSGSERKETKELLDY